MKELPKSFFEEPKNELDVEMLERFIGGADEAWENVEEKNVNFVMTIYQAYKLAISVKILLEERKRGIEHDQNGH